MIASIAVLAVGKKVQESIIASFAEHIPFYPLTPDALSNEQI